MEFIKEEMGISMDIKQGMLFTKTPEFEMQWDVAAPPPRISAMTMNLTPTEIKALDEYWGFKAYLYSKE